MGFFLCYGYLLYMKKIIRLTESDLTRLVERVIAETGADSKVRFLKLDKKLKEKYYNDVCKIGKLVPKDPEVEEYQEVHNQIKSPLLKIDGLLKGATKKVFCTVNHKL